MTSPRLQHTQHMSHTDTPFIQGDNAKVSADPSSMLEKPEVHLCLVGRGWQTGTFLTPDRARELAAQLLSAAAACDAQNEGKLQRA